MTGEERQERTGEEGRGQERTGEDRKEEERRGQQRIGHVEEKKRDNEGMGIMEE